MSSSKDYIPQNQAAFNAWFENLKNHVDENDWGIPDRVKDELDAAFLDWRKHYEPTLGPHTPGQTIARNEARKRAEAVIRMLVKQYLQFPPVTNSNRSDMRLHIRDLIRTDHRTVKERVEFNLDIQGIRQVHVHFKVSGSAGKAKPQGYSGAVLVWATLDSPPVDIKELIFHAMASRTPHTITFTEQDRGKKVYVALAWQNDRGIRGAWSEIKWAVIP